MTTATHTQGLQAMYPAAQQFQQPFQGMQPQFGFGQMPYSQQYGQQQYAYPQQLQQPFGYVGQQWPGQGVPQPHGQGIQQQVAFELFRLAQIVQSTRQLVG